VVFEQIQSFEDLCEEFQQHAPRSAD
jgi:hypothetical protein